jgi:rhomboid protease GluP
MKNKASRHLGHFVLKMQLVYLPFLGVSLLTVLGYTFFNWLFNIELGILHLKEDVVNFFIPLFFVWLPIIFFLRRRVHMLDVAGERNNGHFFYQFVMWAVMAIPMVILQIYIGKASFDLVEIESIDRVAESQEERYFRIRKFDIDRSQCASYVNARHTLERHENDFDIYLYIACPFSRPEISVWYGILYQTNISQWVGPEEKERRYKDFMDRSFKAFEKFDFHKVSYFQRLEYSDDLDGYLGAITRDGEQPLSGEQVILLPQSGAFQERLGNMLTWAWVSYVIGALVVFLMVAFAKYEECWALIAKEKKHDDTFWAVVGFRDSWGRYKASSIILWLNIAVFAAMVLAGISPVSPTAGELLRFGANNRDAVMSGEGWRLITSVFVHMGIMHLAYNMCGLGLAALYLDSVLGLKKMLGVYLVCGIAASIASIIWTQITSVGASGAILGLYGILLALALGQFYVDRKLILILVALFAGGSIAFGFLIHADNAAHIGGFVSGILVGIVLLVFGRSGLKNPDDPGGSRLSTIYKDSI